MDNKEKFTNRVENYAKYRPTYPQEFIQYLSSDVGIAEDAVVADIGAGTGILTRLLADHVKTIYAVEPNGEMRKACEKSCKEFKSFVSIDASAEDTSLPDSSADFITVAQAFHWFDKEKAGLEFRRILRPDSKVVLVWNSRVSDNEFIIENDELCRQLCKDYTGFSGGSGHEADVNRDFFRDGHCDYGFSKTTDCSHLKNTSVAVYRHPMHL